MVLGEFKFQSLREILFYLESHHMLLIFLVDNVLIVKIISTWNSSQVYDYCL